MCDKGEQWQQALALLGEMWEAKLEPDVVSYNAGIGACETGGRWQRAAALISEKWETKLEPEVISYSSRSGACEKCQQWQQGLPIARRDAGGEIGVERYQLALGSARARKASSGSRLCRFPARCGRRNWNPSSSILQCREQRVPSHQSDKTGGHAGGLPRRPRLYWFVLYWWVLYWFVL